ncbi:DUF6049 family protein [Glaciihabitans sp. UYNi722]|uniref:DUF6049 family protein n=1 Tax=Glaciihabitans sp. UYNi722 TaxID=3156344 RepID=UPI00339495C4
MRLLTSLIALAMAIGAVVLPSAAQAADAPAATVAFAPQNSGVLSPGQDLVLDGTLSNPTTVSIPAGTASVYVTQSIVKSRSELSGWLNPETTSANDELGTKLIDVPTPEIPAGRSNIPLRVTVPAAAIALPADWGAHTLAVRVTAGDTEVGQGRSSLVWYPGGVTPQTRLAMALPLSVPAGTEGLIPSDQLASYTGAGGLLTRELDFAITDPNIAIGIDPRIIASIAILGTSAPESARQWLLRLDAVANETFALSYADSDLAVASQAGLKSPPVPDFIIDPKLFPNATVVPTPSTGTPPNTPTPSATGAPTVPTVPTPQNVTDWAYTLTGIAWPSDGTVVGPDLDNFAANGLTTTILSSTNLSFGDLDYTPTGAARIGDDATVVSDSAVSALFRAATEASNQAEWRIAMAKLTATLAVVSAERPTDARTILATLDRTNPGDQFFLFDTVKALFALSWVGPAPLSDLTTAAAASPATATITAQPEAADRVVSTAAMFAAETSVGSFASVLVDPRNLTVERRQSLLALLANSWVSNPDWQAAATKYLTRSTELTKSVKIAETGFQFLPSSSSPLRITVSNTLDYPVKVNVAVRSPSGILDISTAPVELTIEANSQAKASVPSKALANGDVTVRASLSSASAVPIGTPAFIKVEVRAQWETALTAIIALLIVGVFGFGIYRNIAKRRRAKKARAEGEVASDDETAADDESVSEVPANEAHSEDPADDAPAETALPTESPDR